jgi:nucleotidyltransferase substrate binding protein (TIGR01987 family)
MLELTVFKKAIDTLKESMEWCSRPVASVPSEILRDSAIQRFEYSYDLAWKMMRRWLRLNIGASYVDGLTRKDMFRLAAEHHLIEDPLRWFEFHEARNLTSHIYDESIAGEVFSVVGGFVECAERLFTELEKRND